MFWEGAVLANLAPVVVVTVNASRPNREIYRPLNNHPNPSQQFTSIMDDRIDFDINDSLKNYLADPLKIPTPEAPSELVDCENDPESFTPALINSILNPVVDSVADNPEAITRRCNFDTLQFLLKCAPTAPVCDSFGWQVDASVASLRDGRRSSVPFRYSAREQNSNCALFARCRSSSALPAASLGKILDLVVSSLSHQVDMANADIEADEQDSISHHKRLLEVFGFLLQWTLATVETKAMEKQASAPAGRGRKGGAKSKAGGKDASWDASSQITTAMDVMSKVLKLKLIRLFVTTSERDTFVSLFTRPVYLVLENESRVKSTVIKMHAFKVLCIAVKHHGHALGKHHGAWFTSLIAAAAQTHIVQSLSYFEHLSEPMAEFLQILSEQYDYPQLAEEVLKWVPR
jgi:condensin complex subunit 1